jgi:hypothetical protein
LKLPSAIASGAKMLSPCRTTARWGKDGGGPSVQWAAVRTIVGATRTPLQAFAFTQVPFGSCTCWPTKTT